MYAASPEGSGGCREGWVVGVNVASGVALLKQEGVFVMIWIVQLLHEDEFSLESWYRKSDECRASQ